MTIAVHDDRRRPVSEAKLIGTPTHCAPGLTLRRVRAEPSRVWRAASRAVALFSRAGIDFRFLAAVVDASSVKQGGRMSEAIAQLAQSIVLRDQQVPEKRTLLFNSCKALALVEHDRRVTNEGVAAK